MFQACFDRPPPAASPCAFPPGVRRHVVGEAQHRPSWRRKDARSARPERLPGHRFAGASSSVRQADRHVDDDERVRQWPGEQRVDPARDAATHFPIGPAPRNVKPTATATVDAGDPFCINGAIVRRRRDRRVRHCGEICGRRRSSRWHRRCSEWEAAEAGRWVWGKEFGLMVATARTLRQVDKEVGKTT